MSASIRHYMGGFSPLKTARDLSGRLASLSRFSDASTLGTLAGGGLLLRLVDASSKPTAAPFSIAAIFNKRASRNLKLHARVNGVDDVSSAITLTTGAAFWYLSATFPKAPGSVAWTASAINLCQLGLESA